ncbi:hypothetical protein EON82_21420, partial [bacterium]
MRLNAGAFTSPIFQSNADGTPPVPGEESFRGAFLPGQLVAIGDAESEINVWSSVEPDGATPAPLRAVGFQIQPLAYGEYRAEIRAFDPVGGWSDWLVKEGGLSTDDADGSAMFLGIAAENDVPTFT